MISFLESRWPIISIVLLLTLLVALIFFSSSAGTLAIAMLILSLGMAIFFVVCRQMTYRIKTLTSKLKMGSNLQLLTFLRYHYEK